MNTLIDAIIAAVAAGASDEARAAGAQACRTLLAALEAKEGVPLAAPGPVPPIASTADVAAIVAGLKGVPVDQLLDLAIAKLRTLVPSTEAPPVRAFSVPILPIPRRS